MPKTRTLSPRAAIVDYLEKVSSLVKPPDPKWRYKSVSELILKEGQLMPEVVESAASACNNQACFWNSLEYSSVQKDLIYCEGFAMPADIPLPMEHAWVFDPVKNSVIETTWTKPGAAYYGVKFQQDFLMDVIAKRGAARSAVIAIIHGCWVEGGLYVKEGFPHGAISQH